MPIKFRCVCGKKLSAPDGTAGKKARCPKCGHVTRVPEPIIEAEIIAEEEQAEAPQEKTPASEGTELVGRSIDDLKADGEGLKHLQSQLQKREGRKEVATSGKALVVDDEPDTLATVSELLSHHGFEVIQAETGEEAIEKAYKHLPDVVVLDVMLPGINGFEVCRRLKDASTPGRGDYDARTPIVMLTARTKNRDVQYAKAAGADAYLKKPVEPVRLYKKISKVLNR